MGFFKNNKVSSISSTKVTTTDNHTADDVSSLAIKPFPLEQAEEKKEKEWVWVEGYKGTDKDMRCRDFRYEIGKEYSLLKDEEPVLCDKGFHLCLKLDDVFTYYDICNNNRFFKVKALVEKEKVKEPISNNIFWNPLSRPDKLVAKSIIFTEELSIDEIFKDSDIEHLPLEYKEFAVENGIEKAQKKFVKDRLTFAYGDELAFYIVERTDLRKSELAGILADRTDLTMYEKLSLILK